MPLISVITPVYNGERHLAAALDSVLSQSVQDLELLVIDDGSTDSSPEILKSFQARDSRVKVLRNAANLGMTRSLNVGLEQAGGEFVARLDADDIALPGRFQTQLTHLRENGLELSHSNAEFIDDSGNVTGIAARHLDSLTTSWQLLFDGHAFHSSLMWRREAVREKVGGYDERYVVAQDFDFTQRCQWALRMEGLQEPLIQYRIHASATTSKRRGRQLELAQGASVAFLKSNFLCAAARSDEEMAALRRLVLFKDASEWTSEKVLELLPLYSSLWREFLDKKQVSGWTSMGLGLKETATQEMCDITKSFCKPAEISHFGRALSSLAKSFDTTPGNLLLAIARKRMANKLTRAA